jgi:hypothetical protein
MTLINEGPIPGKKRKWMETLIAVSDQGDLYLDAPDSKSNSYYGFLSQIEDEPDDRYPEYTNQTILFDIVPKEWMETSVLNAPWIKNIKLLNRLSPQRPPASFLHIENKKTSDIVQCLSITEKELAETDWYLLELGNEGIEAIRWIAARWNFKDNKYILEPEIKSELSSTRVKGKKLSDDYQDLLRKIFSPKPRLDISKLDRAISRKGQRHGVNFPARGGKIGVMDVGQGSCNLIYDAEGNPRFYFDVGCPKGMYGASANSPILSPGPCVGNGHLTTIILSHWHDDHFNMALLSDNYLHLRGLLWIMPNQPFGPNAAGLFNSIQPANRFVWPLGQSMRRGDIIIIGCARAAGIPARDMNNSGIAIVIQIDPVNGRYALLPGDASFQSIPYRPQGTIVWMTAPHHGSKTHLVPAHIPVAGGIQTRIAISYGIMPTTGRHPYKHPSPVAIAAYQASTILETAEDHPNSGNPPVPPRGNISMCNNAPVQLCGVANCPFHNFPKVLV